MGTADQRQRLNMAAASHIDTAANIASGHGEYALANRLWAFARALRNGEDPQPAPVPPHKVAIDADGYGWWVDE